jgi:hypothetical protein
LNPPTGGYLLARMKRFRTDDTRPRRSAHRRSNLAGLNTIWSGWTEAVEWIREQDDRRAAEQRRFAETRTLAELERLWVLPVATHTGARPDTSRLSDAEPFRRS